MSAGIRCLYGLGLGVSCALAACAGGGADPLAEDNLAGMPSDQVIYGLTHFSTAQGVRRAVLRADTAYVHEDSARIDARRVHLTLFNELGREAADLTAAAGELDIRTEAMTARGNVVLVARQGQKRIETEELHFDPQTDRIWSDVATTLQDAGTVIRGQGFTSDGQLRNVRVRRPTGRVEGLRIEF
ncbi:MAG: LPS export ABC transporter periplasmic protein LptC [Gemmatimonadetes bacterium]|nr:LPS export ABC transporter periplasmic protein LptC [Gemmatimonadota bacterium]